MSKHSGYMVFSSFNIMSFSEYNNNQCHSVILSDSWWVFFSNNYVYKNDPNKSPKLKFLARSYTKGSKKRMSSLLFAQPLTWMTLFVHDFMLSLYSNIAPKFNHEFFMPLISTSNQITKTKSSDSYLWLEEGEKFQREWRFIRDNEERENGRRAR